MLENTGLVLEGGGMRGVYTGGILEYFMEQDLYFPYVIGVSAGACHATSYLSDKEIEIKRSILIMHHIRNIYRIKLMEKTSAI